MNLTRLMTTTVFVVMGLLVSVSQAQTRGDLLSYMRANRVSLLTASSALGVSMGDAAKAFGFQGTMEFFIANSESALVFAECVIPFVDVTGSAARIGLVPDRLTEYATLRLRSDLSFLPGCNEDSNGTRVFLFFTVWTVGDDYPVAYHISARARLLLVPDGVPDDPHENSYLGYANANQVLGQVEDIIRDEVRTLALKVAAVR
jgi:hypothetical protein